MWLGSLTREPRALSKDACFVQELLRAVSTLASTLPLEARVKIGDETIPMKHGLMYKATPNADGKFRALNTDGIENGGAFDGAAHAGGAHHAVPSDAAVHRERGRRF